MYTVLLPVDESEARAKRAVETVLDLPGDPDDVSVVVLNVAEATKQPWLQELEDPSMDDADVPDSVDVAVDLLAEAGIAVEKRWEHGDVTEEIVDVAAEIEADSIIMSGRKRSKAGKVLFGSIAQSVLLNADRPVTVLMN